MRHAIFITGTDTDVGKTFVSCLLLQAFNRLGLKTFALKPIASGSKKNDAGELRNSDAQYLQHNASIKTSYEAVNPIVFEKPIAPHIAACETNTPLTKELLCQTIMSSIRDDADINLIEGAGGWSVPLNASELYSDVIIELKIPIILVVGIKLGCLNHALLTQRDILARGGMVIGWIANCLDPNMQSIEDNIETLNNWLNFPCLGIVPYIPKDIGYNNSEACIDTTIIQQQLFQQSRIARREG